MEFLTGQLISGALPLDRDVIKELLELAATTEGERGDRAWVALLTRTRPDAETLERQAEAARAAQRPRVLWRLDALRGHVAAAIDCFFNIEKKSEDDVDELLEYVRGRDLSPAGGDKARAALARHLPALVALRPCSAAALLADHFPDEIAPAMDAAPADPALEFGERLRETGRLRGPAATVHLRRLCALRPHDVTQFLAEEAGRVRPEEALAIVRELGPPDAEATCLEASGDASAALDVLLRLAAADREVIHNIFIYQEVHINLLKKVPKTH